MQYTRLCIYCSFYFISLDFYFKDGNPDNLTESTSTALSTEFEKIGLKWYVCVCNPKWLAVWLSCSEEIITESHGSNSGKDPLLLFQILPAMPNLDLGFTKLSVLYLFSASLAGKEEAVGKDVIPVLVGLLADASTDVRANAAGALMM